MIVRLQCPRLGGSFRGLLPWSHSLTLEGITTTPSRFSIPPCPIERTDQTSHLLLRLLSFAARRHDLTQVERLSQRQIRLRLALITVTNTKRAENCENRKARRLKILDGVNQHSVETVPEVSEDRWGRFVTGHPNIGGKF